MAGVHVDTAWRRLEHNNSEQAIEMLKEGLLHISHCFIIWRRALDRASKAAVLVRSYGVYKEVVRTVELKGNAGKQTETGSASWCKVEKISRTRTSLRRHLWSHGVQHGSAGEDPGQP